MQYKQPLTSLNQPKAGNHLSKHHTQAQKHTSKPLSVNNKFNKQA